jgi:hypothetical protein
MPKTSEEPLEAIQLRLFKRDLESLRKLYGGSFGVNKAIRTIIRAYLTQVEEKSRQLIDENETALSDSAAAVDQLLTEVN